MKYEKGNITYTATAEGEEDFYVVGYHDCQIKDFQYNYNDKLLRMTFLEETKSRNDYIYAVFEEVVYCEIQNLDFWGEGIYVNALTIGDYPEVWARIEAMKAKEIERGVNPYEYDLSEMIIVSILMNSGAVFNIVCRSMVDSQQQKK